MPAPKRLTPGQHRKQINRLLDLADSMTGKVIECNEKLSRKELAAMAGQIAYWTNAASGITWAARVLEQEYKSDGKAAKAAKQKLAKSHTRGRSRPSGRSIA